MKVDNYEVREGLLYTKEHEWAKIEGNLIRVGITDYAQKMLHDIVYVELPEVGAKVEQMRPMGTVESVKVASDVYAPFSGEVVEVNKRLEESPELINQDPYGEGWICIIRPSNLEGERGKLLTAQQYADFLRDLLGK